MNGHVIPSQMWSWRKKIAHSAPFWCVCLGDFTLIFTPPSSLPLFFPFLYGCVIVKLDKGGKKMQYFL